MTSPSGTEIGDVVGGRYRIERVLGAGGMGRVVLARHAITERHVALKFLLDDLANAPEAAARFLNEARAAVQIESEHVARVLDVDVLPSGAPYMVIEYLDGNDLALTLSQIGQLPVQRAVDYVLEACVAIAEAHALGIVHRDLKPGNLFLARRKDGSTIVNVLDFGIAKALTASDRALDAARTRTGGVLGSPPYMSPEQLIAPQQVDVRTDIWALGVVLYELATGLRPFRAEPLSLQIIEIVQQPHVPLERMITGVDPRLSAAIDRCLQKRPDDRFPDVAALASALSFVASENGKAAARKTRAMLSTSRRPDLASPGGFGLAEDATRDEREDETNVLGRPPREPAEPATTRPKPDLYGDAAVSSSVSSSIEPATIAIAAPGGAPVPAKTPSAEERREPKPGARLAVVIPLVVVALAVAGALALTVARALAPTATPASSGAAGRPTVDAPAASTTATATASTPTPIAPVTATSGTAAAAPATAKTATTKTATTKGLGDGRAAPATVAPTAAPPPTTGVWGGQH